MLTDDLKLNEKGEVISVVGAGGKTSIINALAQEFLFLGKKVIITTTTHLRKPTGETEKVLILENRPAEAIRKIKEVFQRSNLALWANKETSEGKISGVLPTAVDIIAASKISDFILIEADGSRGLPIKAPALHEPVIPDATNVLIGVIGVDAVGHTIDTKNVHRPEILKNLLQNPNAEVVDEEVILKLICHQNGLFKGAADNMKKVVVINKVDDEQKLIIATKLGQLIKEQNSVDIFCILLTSFKSKECRVVVI